MSKFKIGDIINIQLKEKICNGEIVHIFKAFEIPEKDKVIKYYGKNN